MDIEAFRQSPVGRLVPTVEGQEAFVPHPVPRALGLSADLIFRLDEATRELATLRGAGEGVPDLELLTRAYLNREAVLSSRIEGTVSGIADIHFLEMEEQRRPKQAAMHGPSGDPRMSAARRDAHEVRNYVRAVEYGRRRLEALPICGRLVREAHAVLLEGVRGAETRPGEWRDRPVWIGPADSPIERATFVPPPSGYIPDLIGDWERFVDEPGRLPPLVACALMHYQFETIHPFRDGNGRLGRVLITLFLQAKGILPFPLLYLSDYFERHRSRYYSCLHGVSAEGDWDAWLEFFLTGVAEESRDALVRARRLRELREEYRERARAATRSANAQRLVDRLFSYPLMSNDFAAGLVGMTHAGARNVLERLADAGIVRREPGSWPTLYVARELLDLLEAPRAPEVPD